MFHVHAEFYVLHSVKLQWVIVEVTIDDRMI